MKKGKGKTTNTSGGSIIKKGRTRHNKHNQSERKKYNQAEKKKMWKSPEEIRIIKIPEGTK